MSELFIKPQYLEMLQNILKNYCPQAEVWAYGSRIDGTAHDGSDLDLVIKSFNAKDKRLYELRELFTESNIPFIIDVHEFDYLPDSFQKEILRNYIPIKF